MTQAILAGFLIGIGDIVLAASENFYIGTLLFAVALMSIIYFELPLYTGKIGRVIKDKTFAGCALILVFNVIGVTLAVWLFTLMDTSNTFCIEYYSKFKFGKGYLALFIAGILCNVLIHLAVSTKHTIIVVLCVMTFIICGFEHSIADAPYLTLDFSWNHLMSWLCILVGNTVGGIATEWMLTFMADKVYSKNDKLSDDVDNIANELKGE